MIEKDNKYTAMQLKQYNVEAEKWSLKERGHVIGNWEENNNKHDKDLLFRGIELSQCVGLDFGCGPGRNLVRFGREFQRLDGVDISPTCIEKAQLHLRAEGIEPDTINLYTCNGIDLECIPSEIYDVIMSTITLQHICVYEIRLNYFKEFFRILNPNGILTAQMGFGDREDGCEYFENFYEADGTNGWHDVMIHDPADLQKDLEDIGFKDFTYSIEPCGGGDMHDNWIYFRAHK